MMWTPVSYKNVSLLMLKFCINSVLMSECFEQFSAEKQDLNIITNIVFALLLSPSKLIFAKKVFEIQLRLISLHFILKF